MNHKKNIVYVLISLIINFFIYRQLFQYFNLSLNLSMYGIFVLLLFSYYIFDVLNFRYKFRAKDFVYSTFLNFIAFSIFYFFHKKSIIMIIFIIYNITQNILSYFLHTFNKRKLNVLVIDNQNYINNIKEIVSHSQNYEYIGYVNDLDIKEDKYYLGKISDIQTIVSQNFIDIIVFTKNDLVKEYADLLVSIKLKGIIMLDYFLFLEEFEGKIDTDKIDSFWVLMTDSFNNCGSTIQKRSKRVFDILLSIFLLVLFSPFMIFTYLLVKCDIGFKYLVLNPRKIFSNPALFKQKRIGYRGQEFEILKFRSMKIHDPKKYSKYASENDERITKIGKFIRKTRLDELPQIINVFKGDMSFVGPRPEWNELGHQYEKEIKNYNLRYAVQPGITGWAQTMYTYGASVNDAKIKLEYDLYYVKNCSLILDIIILFKTTKTIIFRKGI